MPPSWQLVDRAPLRDAYENWVVFVGASHGGVNHRTNDEVSFVPLAKAVSESRVALVTTAGAHLDDQEPFHVATTAGDDSFRIIPHDVDLGRLRFTHTHYDTSSASADPDVVLPIDTLRAAVTDGRVGSASPVHIGMMGFNPDPSKIAEYSGPAVADVLVDNDVDLAVLVPG